MFHQMYIFYCLLFALRRSCCFKDGPVTNRLKVFFFFYVETLLLLLAVVFTRYLQSRSHTLFIQGLNLYPLEIMATAQDVANYQDWVWYLSPEVSTLFTCKRLRKKPLKWTGSQSSFCVILQNDKGFVKFAWISLIFITVSSITVILSSAPYFVSPLGI